MNFHERLLQFITSTQLWADLDETQRANVDRIVKWARSLGHNPAMYVARVLQRFFVVMSQDEPGSTKWKQKADAILKDYPEARVVKDFFFFAKPNNQFAQVFNRYTEMAKTNTVVANALAGIKYTSESGVDLPSDEIYNELNSVGGKVSKLETLPVGKPIVALPNGAKWVELDTHGCAEEGDLMKHCGNIGGKTGDHMLSYREPSAAMKGYFEPKLTFIYSPKGKALGEMKGMANTKAKPEYHPAIIALLKSGMIDKLVGGGYRAGVNFSLNDLPKDQFLDVAQAQPQIVKNSLNATDKFQKLDNEHRKWLKGAGTAASAIAASPDSTEDEVEDGELPEALRAGW